MGNLGAFINITGSDLTPQYKTYAAVVSILPPFRTKKSSKHYCFFSATSQSQTDGVRQLAKHACVVPLLERQSERAEQIEFNQQLPPYERLRERAPFSKK